MNTHPDPAAGSLAGLAGAVMPTQMQITWRTT
jgi:hypothetical protein